MRRFQAKNNPNEILFRKNIITTRVQTNFTPGKKQFSKVFNVKLRSDIRQTTCKPRFANFFQVEKDNSSQKLIANLNSSHISHFFSSK